MKRFLERHEEIYTFLLFIGIVLVSIVLGVGIVAISEKL